MNLTDYPIRRATPPSVHHDLFVDKLKSALNGTEYSGPGWTTPPELWPTAVEKWRRNWKPEPEDDCVMTVSELRNKLANLECDDVIEVGTAGDYEAWLEVWRGGAKLADLGDVTEPEDERMTTVSALRIVTGHVGPPSQYHPQTRFVVLLMRDNDVLAVKEYRKPLEDGEMFHAIRSLADAVGEKILELRKPYEEIEPCQD